MYRLSLLLALTGVLASLGCSAAASCDTGREENPDKYTQGAVFKGAYASSPWDSSWLAFPGGKEYLIMHKLGCVPNTVNCYESFDESGTHSESTAQAAGNMCEFVEMTSEYVRIKNNTCSDFFVYITASDCNAFSAGVDSSVDGGADSFADAGAD
jgi:hypothetical protein